VPGKDWLLLSQVFEGPHFKKAAVTSKKLSFAQPSWTPQADPADPSRKILDLSIIRHPPLSWTTIQGSALTDSI
jgi:hypothetical protein